MGRNWLVRFNSSKNKLVTFLRYKRDSVVVDGNYPEDKVINAGVPQVSLLGQTLYFT